MFEIFFILYQAPTPPPAVQEVQDEHKTLVYVLVKNPAQPEPQADITEPSKPEVYFVKYKGNIEQ